MAPDNPQLFESGDLSICPQLGELRNSRGDVARLGPVNMKVLALLLSRPGRVVSRNELFEAVWKNQVVGDDALTRCISDIRAELSQLSGCNGHIETIPKRGYRWVADVRETFATGAPVSRPVRQDTPIAGHARRTFRQRALFAWVGRGLAYLAALVLIASLGVWLIEQFARPRQPVIAVLPIPAQASQRELAAGIEKQLAEYLMRLDRVDLLSRSAIESRPSNPFPYFHYEFGARWLVESELRSLAGQTVLTVVLVDARTGIVLFQSTQPVAGDGEASVAAVERAFQPLEAFIESQLGR